MEEMQEPKKEVKQRGQILPTVMLISVLIGFMAYSMASFYRNEAKSFVTHVNISKKYELASVALEHARYKIQSGNRWFQLPLEGMMYDEEYSIAGLGTYSIDIEKGNLFMESDGTRQGENEYRTIGMKIKVSPSNKTHRFYAVIKRVGFGGPLVSRGKIDLPCTGTAITNSQFNFYWGDIYHGNTTDGTCRIPSIPVAIGTGTPPGWAPSVFSRSNIYTALSKSGSTYSFGYTYDDMSPTAKTHPYSNAAKVPSVSLNAYRQIAQRQGNYYGPAMIGGVGSNPYYIDSDHEVNDVTGSLIASKLTYTAAVFFVDTTDGLPVRVPGNVSTPTNTYSGVTYVATGSLGIYKNDCEQLYTVGSLLVLGPLVLKGDDPGPGLPNGNIDPQAEYYPVVLGVNPPDNYYYPQGSDGAHLNVGNSKVSNYLEDVKHYGFLYVDGELKIGGTRCFTLCQAPKETRYASAREETNWAAIALKLVEPRSLYAGMPPTDTPVPTKTPTITRTPTVGPSPTNTATATPVPCSGSGTPPTSDICVYGTIFLGDTGSLTADITNDTPKLYVYYNIYANAFAYVQDSVVVTSFREITYLVPTPEPVYPTGLP